MYPHAPQNYVCPFCLAVQGIENEQNLIKPSDIVYQNEWVTAFIAVRRWPNNVGHVVIIPNEHFENIYDIPVTILNQINAASKMIALAMKQSYQCDGVLIRQHNEPAGDQQIFHYHLHVIPRYVKDNFHQSQKLAFPPKEREIYAQRLRKHLDEDGHFQ